MKVSVPLPEVPTLGSPTNLDEIRDGLRSGLYSPTPSQKRCKASFWSRYTPGPSTPLPENISLVFAQELTNSPGLKKWWSEAGFRSWFLNREEAREQVEYLFDRSLEVAEDILSSDTAKPGDKVALIKFLAELAGKMPKNTAQAEKYADDDIGKMDENQLKAFLTRKGVLIGSGKAPIKEGELNPVMEATTIEEEKK